MRIIELEVSEIRGLRQIVLRPNGKNVVITGPNGSGKSGVVDAIDFLLTGQIQRLSGKGTKALSLKRHGVHVGASPSETKVRAIVALPGHNRHIEISRSIAQPGSLVCKPEDMKALRPVLEMAGRGQHVLSRREILKFITAESGDRAQEIQALLDLSDIEDVRQTFMRVRNDLKKTYDGRQRELQSCESNVASAAQLRGMDSGALLSVVNEQRLTLAGLPHSELQLYDLKGGLSAPIIAPKSEINIVLFETDARKLSEIMSPDAIAKRTLIGTKLRAEVQSLMDHPTKLRDADRLRLLELGYALLDDDGSCPLCDTTWAEGTLAEYLQARMARAKEVSDKVTLLQSMTSVILTDVRSAKALIAQLLNVSVRSAANACFDLLLGWQTVLSTIEGNLVEPLRSNQGSTIDWDQIANLGEPPDTMSSVAALCDHLKASIPESSPQQTAWDLLTRIEEHTKLWGMAQAQAATARATYGRAAELYATFEQARNRELQGLYDKIKDRFVELYREIHGSDEAAFDAAIRPEGAGLTFEVDFYGTGVHPPHALHSEGHQDSMGLCLYLALAEYLNRGVIDLIVLDDVVMSVDTGHRREVCRVLSQHFSNHQFLITTHERAWAGQLKAERVVTSANCISFYNWTLDGGPCVDQASGDGGMWAEIRADLERNDVNGAAAALRYGLELFFRQACGNLRAPIPYNLQEKWDLGEYLNASVSRYKKLVKDAINAANAWGNTEEATRLAELASLLDQTFARTQAEQWVINPNVHYNPWANFSKQDFEPVVEAMQELCQQFMCHKCVKLIEVQGVGLDNTVIKCPCGNLTLNLEKPNRQAKSVAIAGPV